LEETKFEEKAGRVTGGQKRVATDPFYMTKEWYKTRARALRANRAVYGGQLTCVVCGKWITDRANVDHIVRRRVRPDLAYELSNLQVLHQACHSGLKRVIDNASERPEIGMDGFPDAWR
jgi:5-methylcytosine-specific restriction endonuclease McrA